MSASLPRLAARMLRYRVAAMIWMFMLLGAAWQGQPLRLDLRLAAAVVALGCCYVAATTLNDLADEDIDRINHPGDPGRPLVSGHASRRDLYVLHGLAAVAALVAAAPLGAAGVGIVALSLLIGQGYSARPLRFSYRTWLAPVVLAVAYVVVPYSLGLVAVGATFGASDALFCGALYALFVARINLKDFRDRDGDRRCGRPTLLLRFGKDVTCLVSLLALAAGSLLLVAAARPGAALGLAVAGYVAAIGSRLHALWRAAEPEAEQVAIGVGAKMGNGLLVTVLGVLVLAGEGAGAGEQALLVAALSAVYGLSFVMLLSRPDRAVIAYKG